MQRCLVRSLSQKSSKQASLYIKDMYTRPAFIYLTCLIDMPHSLVSSCLPAGLRIMTSTSHQLLRRVPPPAVRVLEMGSTCPGALLYDARRLFDAQDARATGEGYGSCGGGGGPCGVWVPGLAGRRQL